MKMLWRYLYTFSYNTASLFSLYVGKQTFVIKLNGQTVLSCCWQITLVNNACNVDLVVRFCTWSSNQQPLRETCRLVKHQQHQPQRGRLWSNSLTHTHARTHTHVNWKVLLTGSFWLDLAAGGRLQKIQRGSPDLRFSPEHVRCPDWRLRPGGARHSTHTADANTWPCCCYNPPEAGWDYGAWAIERRWNKCQTTL